MQELTIPIFSYNSTFKSKKQLKMLSIELMQKN